VGENNSFVAARTNTSSFFAECLPLLRALPVRCLGLVDSIAATSPAAPPTGRTLSNSGGGRRVESFNSTPVCVLHFGFPGGSGRGCSNCQLLRATSPPGCCSKQ
jgi:hypothetical protein